MSVWLPRAPCMRGTCVEATGSAAAAPRAVLRLTALALLILAAVALTPLARRIPAAWTRRWCRAVVRAAGVRVRVTGAAAPSGGLLLVANHVSWLDVPLLAAVRPARMLAKAEIRRWPVAGPLAARGGALFIERDRLRALPQTVDRIARALRSGDAVAAFPEGSTWCGRAEGRFHRAVFQAALDAGAPVQPVRIRYRTPGGGASTVPAFVGDDSLLASLWRVASARALLAEVEVRPVIPPGAHPDRRALARAARSAAAAGPHRTHACAADAAPPAAGGGRVRPRGSDAAHGVQRLGVGARPVEQRGAAEVPHRGAVDGLAAGQEAALAGRVEAQVHPDVVDRDGGVVVA
ncbi:lysophospholipid acyltransferase family protein [Streptomyces sp. NPDC046985]|uniref:lysophospholipid acyltransferase family protein n=1 Tax=Streptomyces sp. NPDC046985 TaxID=3155377 RepID=UPI0033DBE02B